MLVADKPPLTEDLLIHYGIKGMKWGRRKTTTSSGDKPKMSTTKKVAIGTGVAVGAAAVAIILFRRGRTPVVQLSRKEKFRQAIRNGTRETVAMFDPRKKPTRAQLLRGYVTTAVNPINWTKPFI